MKNINEDKKAKMTKTKVKKLTESQLEIIRFLSRGCYIYNNWRSKWYITPLKRADGTTKKAQSGHTNEYMYNEEGTHLYRPTVNFFIKSQIVIPRTTKEGRVMTKNGEAQYELNRDHPEYADQIQMAMVEGALGVTRESKKDKDDE